MWTKLKVEGKSESYVVQSPHFLFEMLDRGRWRGWTAVGGDSRVGVVSVVIDEVVREDVCPERDPVHVHPAALLLAILPVEVIRWLLDVLPATHVVHFCRLNWHATCASEEWKYDLVAHLASLLHHCLHVGCLVATAKASNADKQRSFLVL